MYVMTGHPELRNKALEAALDTVRDNITCFYELAVEFDKIELEERLVDVNKPARLISFGATAVEKLLMLNLYVRNPILLLPDDKITKEHFLSAVGYKKFDVEWLYSASSQFISPKDMWEIVKSILPIAPYQAEFHYIKGIRNKYLHNFIKAVAPRSVFIINRTLWLLLIELLDGLASVVTLDTEEFLGQCGLDGAQLEVLKKIGEKNAIDEVVTLFPNLYDSIVKQPSRDIRRDMLLQAMYATEYLSAEIPRYIGGEPDLILTPEGDEVHLTDTRRELLKKQEITIDCPSCLDSFQVEETGFLSVDVYDLEYDTDADGDAEFWKDPISAVASFSHFYCINCAFHSSDGFLLEKIPPYDRVLKLPIWFDWNINDGVTHAYVDESQGIDMEY